MLRIYADAFYRLRVRLNMYLVEINECILGY